MQPCCMWSCGSTATRHVIRALRHRHHLEARAAEELAAVEQQEPVAVVPHKVGGMGPLEQEGHRHVMKTEGHPKAGHPKEKRRS